MIDCDAIVADPNNRNKDFPPHDAYVECVNCTVPFCKTHGGKQGSACPECGGRLEII
jgi:hypothetical protein